MSILEDEKSIRLRKKASEELAEFTRTLGNATLGLAGIGSVSSPGAGGAKGAGGHLNDGVTLLNALGLAASTAAAGLAELNPMFSELTESVGGGVRQLTNYAPDAMNAVQSTTNAFAPFAVAGLDIPTESVRMLYEAELAKNQAVTGFRAQVQGIAVQSAGQSLWRGVVDPARHALGLGGAGL